MTAVADVTAGSRPASNPPASPPSHPYTRYFAQRADDDRLDVVSLLRAGLAAPQGNTKPVVVFEGEAIDRAAMAQRVAALQAWFAARGLTPGDRVAVMLGNSAAQIALIYALMLSGLVWVPVNTRLKGDGLDYLLGHAKPRLLIAEPAFADVLDAADALTAEAGQPRDIARFMLGDVLTEAAGFAGASLAVTSIAPEHVLCIIYTSGTTGAPKGVLFTHRMMRIASEAAMRVADAHDGDRLFLWEPLCHIGGAQMLLLPFLCDVELHVVERFSASRFWQQCAQSQATQLHYLGGILDILMQLPPDAQPATHSLRVAWGAGVSASAWHATRARLQVALRECYGMTECASFATLNDSDTPGSIGMPLPWLTVELLDDDGHEVPHGEIGEIVLSSDVAGVFLPGYLDNPEASAKALRDGKLFTGDSARRSDDGQLVFVGRRTDSMRVRGENVSAWEIERVFARHPAVAACAAIGVASAIGEQDVMLYVQFRDQDVPAWPALADWAADKLASYQLPRYYRRAARFETTPSERIRKHLLPRETGDAWDSRLSK